MLKYLLPPLLAVGCAPVPALQQADRPIPAIPPPQLIAPGFDRVSVERDLLATARHRFGEPLVRRALASESYILAKHYPGMLPPPPPDAGPGWRYPDPPSAMLIREDGEWLKATAEGFRPARPDKAAAIDAVLAGRAFWSEPDWVEPGCTDAGASLLMLKIPNRPETVRRSACGGTELSERLTFLALEA